jgi:hypothetical protein
MVSPLSFVKHVATKIDRGNEIIEALRELESVDILVGVPEESSSREGSGEITNAELGYIHTHGIRRRAMIHEMQPDMDGGRPYSKAFEAYLANNGSPLWHAVPRPFLEPGVDAVKNLIAEEFKAALTSASQGNAQAGVRHMERAGQIAENSVRNRFSREYLAPNREATIRMKGSSQPLIDTGELRKSIRWVRRKK